MKYKFGNKIKFRIGDIVFGRVYNDKIINEDYYSVRSTRSPLYKGARETTLLILKINENHYFNIKCYCLVHKIIMNCCFPHYEGKFKAISKK